VKVLDIMKLRYYHITIQSPENMEVCRKRYIEDTNVYAYYILGGILSAYALPFISWCCQHNQGKGRVGAIRFARNTGTLPKFVDLLAAISRDPVVLSMVAYIENPKMNIQSFHGSTALAKKTMRMTID
jgi:hypothetical protein